MTSVSLKRRVKKVVDALRADYPDAECALRFRNPFELLIATILAAQCTDERVNEVTKTLFALHPTPAALAALPLADLEKLIQPTGFFRNKAKNIQACCRRLVELHGGETPRDFDALVNLPGVGRKTANVVMGTAFGDVTGVVVDTHVGRIVVRLGLTEQTDPVKTERELMELLPGEEWIMFSHRLIWHGRKVCKARSPKCGVCSMRAFCPQIGVES